MKKTYCDHCGREIKDVSIPMTITIGDDTHIEWHEVCKDCVDGFITLVNHYFEYRRKAK